MPGRFTHDRQGSQAATTQHRIGVNVDRVISAPLSQSGGAITPHRLKELPATGNLGMCRARPAEKDTKPPARLEPGPLRP
ncbi:hypothetical protein SL1157_3048 [Ruegeria lacuscaerulensis ITI-1157]|nr:hypothetical protein SL1157_3048 [Ruegeria lacuscaerulensis ITI-1157]